MAQIDVLPRALMSAAGDVLAAVSELQPVPAAEVGHPVLSAAIASYVDGALEVALVDAAEDAARALRASAQEYADIERLLLPRALR